MTKYAYGRGNRTGIVIEDIAYSYAKVSMGNTKHHEPELISTIVDIDELYELSQFFLALWMMWRHNGWNKAEFADDPHDPVLVHDFDFSQEV